MIKVALHGAEFFARHGFYPEEQLLGNKFIVDVEVGFHSKDNLNEDDLANTINYEQLYDIVCVEMEQTRKLIETVGQAIMDQIKTSYSFVEYIHLVIKKLSPPLKGKVEYSSVIMDYSREGNGIQ